MVRDTGRHQDVTESEPVVFFMPFSVSGDGEVSVLWMDDL